MKYAFVLAFAAAVVAQDISTLPPCGQTCVGNMIALAPSLGCDANDAACLCDTDNFQWGIRDCSEAVCGKEDSAPIVAFGKTYCKDAGETSTGASSASATGASTGSGSSTGSASASGTASATGTGAGLSTTAAPLSTQTGGNGNSTATGTGQSSSAITTKAIVSTETSGDNTITTTLGSTTIYSIGGASGRTGTKTDSATATGTGSSTETGSSGSESSAASSTDGAGDATATDTSTAGGAIQTAMPGFAAAMGLAALLL